MCRGKGGQKVSIRRMLPGLAICPGHRGDASVGPLNWLELAMSNWAYRVFSANKAKYCIWSVSCILRNGLFRKKQVERPSRRFVGARRTRSKLRSRNCRIL